MSNSTEGFQAGQTARASGGGILQTILVDLSSAKLATAVGSLIVLACVLGTVLPQGGDVEKFVNARPDAASLMRFLSRIGLTNVFEARWFVALLVFFSLNITACITKRLSGMLRSGRMGLSGWGFLFTHVSMLLILAGAVIRGVAGQKGHLEIQEGQSSAHFMSSKGPVKLPFDIQLVKFEIEYYKEEPSEIPQAAGSDMLSIDWAVNRIETQMVFEVGVPSIIRPRGDGPAGSNTFQVVVSKYVPDFVVDTATHEVSTRSLEPNNPAVLVTIEGTDLSISKWLFANHPDFDMMHAGAKVQGEAVGLTMRYHSANLHPDQTMGQSARIKSFKSTLKLLENGKVVKEKTIEVNSPLSHRGYTLYQSGYNPSDLTWSTLQVVKDPGVPIVYAGFLFMILGLVLLLGFKPAARRPAGGAKLPDREVYHHDVSI